MKKLSSPSVRRGFRDKGSVLLPLVPGSSCAMIVPEVLVWVPVLIPPAFFVSISPRSFR